jgi:hypothetical protein
MAINEVEFADLAKEIVKTAKPVSDYLASKLGKTHVIAITRNGCPACEKQKPNLDKLAAALTQKHGDKVIFTRILVKQTANSREESTRSKELLGHYFYPTNMILFRTHDRGAIEYYRNSSTTMSELKRNIEIAIRIVTMIQKEKAT